MSQLALYLLGAPRVELDGKPVHIGRTKAVALLAYLAVAATSHRRDALATLLWPEYDQSGARADLRRTLSLLNRKLGKGWLVADRETIDLSGSIKPDRSLWLDVEQFRRRLAECDTHARGLDAGDVCADCVPLLEEAVELYRDDFLSGFTLRDSLAFDEWQFFQTQELREALAKALERLARWHGEQGAYETAIPHARRWLALDPLHEAAYQCLMRLYALSGQEAAALRQYQLCRETLAEELGVPPSPGTVALMERIRSGEDIGPERELRPALPHNLPPQPTPFVGREAELAQLEALIAGPEARLVTIVGPGGVGKTRLALAAAEHQLVPLSLSSPPGGIEGGRTPEASFPDGVYFVPLAELSSAEQVVPAMARSVGFTFHGEREPQGQLLDYLREKRLLLVLDNVEHLLASPPEGERIGTSPPVAERAGPSPPPGQFVPRSAAQTGGIEGGLTELLRAAPSVQILSTSRQRLGLHQEQVFPIGGLAYPDRETPDATTYPAVRLFLHSARRAQPHFELADDDLPALTLLCQLLEGMPLGLELASAWVNILSLSDIASETQTSLDFLETDWPDVPSRHRSMRAVLHGSWRRLDTEEQCVLARLSVFRGGFTRAAASEVTGASLRALAGLADKSLLTYDRTSDRYQIHGLTRQYAAERLAGHRDREAAARDCHSAHFCAALERWWRDLMGSRELEALDEIETDLENARAAWGWAVSQRHVDRLDQAMDGLGQFFLERARVAEGDGLFHLACDRLTGLPQPSAVEAQRTLARALLWRSRFNFILSLPRQAKDLLQQSRLSLESPALAGHDIRSERALLQELLGRATQPDWETSARHYEQALALHQEVEHRCSAAWVLCRLGESNCRSGKPETGLQNYEEALVLFRALGHQSGLCWALVCLGSAARSAGDYDRAQRMYNESLTLARAQGDRRRTIDSLRHMGYLALFLGDFHASASYLEESIAISRAVGDWIRVTITSGDLATAYWFSGAFDQACAVLEGILTLIGERDLANSHYAIAYQAWLDVYAGRYDEARTHAWESLELNPHDESYGPPSVVPRWVLGWAALADEAYAKACQPLRQANAVLRKGLVDESQEFIAWSMAPLGRAFLGLGDRKAARRHLSEGLEITVAIRGFIPLLHLMPVISVALADEEDPSLKERAVELYALATSHPFVAKAQLFEDIAGRYVKAAAACLPPDVVRAAEARGQALDWWETAGELIGELRDMGWSR